ncbi:ATP-grasp domain-containing protein [Amycolatopsis sp. SID8362]|uniref:ATP-grasp domain-containing protein n=1 Tax=Amycolatopsis sp. SID8362 TaxID=2690346 RepID=UPI00136832E0|nr:ATP-grasp domain-containing protein [Amycolatopsis sp. SID8362]NBH05124.1 ATP-grasp domain-containing protein [Amycolatopsis sp. SID8362]NED41824.1 ATP-grasp domain-containing protein [Amycolatopsis sp. SID8362]
MPETLLFVGGARPLSFSLDMAAEALAQAAARGLRVHVTNTAEVLAATEDVVGKASATSTVDVLRPGASAAWAKAQDEHFDAVYALQELAQVAVAETAQAVGAPGNPPEAVHRVRTKDACREALAAAGFPQPVVRLCADAAAAEAFLGEHAGPWIVKPRDAMGSTGVSLVTEPGQLPGAIALLPDAKPFLVEQFVEGPEFSVEGVFLGGEPKILAITAKEKVPPPFFVETGHVLPAPLPEARRREIEAQVTSALKTLGLRVGGFHVELWLTAAGVVLGEVHGRFGGDWIHRMLAHAIPGLELYGLVFDDMLGRPVTDVPLEPSRGAAVRYFTPPPGRLAAVEGWDEVLAHPAVLHAELSVGPGDEIRPLHRSGDRVGLIVVGADTPEAASALAADLVDSVKFVPDAEPDRLPGLWALR